MELTRGHAGDAGQQSAQRNLPIREEKSSTGFLPVAFRELHMIHGS